jgi:hypothetical protein
MRSLIIGFLRVNHRFPARQSSPLYAHHRLCTDIIGRRRFSTRERRPRAIECENVELFCTDIIGRHSRVSTEGAKSFTGHRPLPAFQVLVGPACRTYGRCRLAR